MLEPRLQVLQLDFRLSVVGEAMGDVFENSVDFVVEFQGKVFNFLAHCTQNFVLLVHAQLKRFNVLVCFLNHYEQLFRAHFELVDLFIDIAARFHCLVSNTSELILLLQHLDYLALRLLDCRAAVVDLRLDVLCLRRVFLNRFGKVRTQLTPQLIDEFLTEAVRVHVVLVNQRYLLVAVIIAPRELAPVLRWNEAIHAHLCE